MDVSWAYNKPLQDLPVHHVHNRPLTILYKQIPNESNHQEQGTDEY